MITNALNVANVLATMGEIDRNPGCGMLRNSEMSMIGHLAEKELADLSVQRVVMSIRALSIELGLSNERWLGPSMDRAIVRCAPTLILVADHSKLGKTASVTIGAGQRVPPPRDRYACFP